jgi:hypothetical protein
LIMKRVLLFLAIVVFSLSTYSVRPALAQSATPPAGPLGEVHGTVINQNTGKVVAQNLEVMLHILDLDYADKDMLHGQSQPDGSFVFTDVPFDASLQFAVMTTFDGVTYYSPVQPADMNSLKVALDVPVYETTKDLATVQVDQMHVLFDFTADGLETKELYIVSNSGERTVKDVYDLSNDKFATLQFPLPKDADYIFFQPDDTDRFVKQEGSFADTYPVLTGDQYSQIMVSYLVPYSGERTYSYTAPINIAKINFLLPEQASISLSGSNLFGPESMSLQDGKSYTVYSYENLQAGETLNITFQGEAAKPESESKKTNNLIAVGAAFFGFALLGAGIWWRRKSDQVEDDETTPPTDEPTLDEVITEIALLDETYEEKGLRSEEYQNQRKGLLQKAKSLS